MLRSRLLRNCVVWAGSCLSDESHFCMQGTQRAISCETLMFPLAVSPVCSRPFNAVQGGGKTAAHFRTSEVEAGHVM
jgi:hypothetical protein